MPSTPRPPTATYRLQINHEFGFDQAAQVCSYLAELGISHVYLSPILQAVPGSMHGYDVIDHSALSQDAGGRAAFERLASAAQAAGLKLITDLVPNHMAVPVPERLNAPLWSVLREGPDSPFANWFDIDWSPGKLLMPVLGNSIGQVLADGELSLEQTGDEPVLRYYEHEFPLRAGTSGLPLEELLAAQHYRLAWWRTGAQELNYRRFFDVTTLAGIRVEDAEVFRASHALIAGLFREGLLDGLRIDHPDGLADPGGYLDWLTEITGGRWVVVEKILEGEETLPANWACAGTTGYDALNVIGGLFVDPAARLPLTQLVMPRATTGERIEQYLDEDIWAAKTDVMEQVLVAEINRLTGLLVRIRDADLTLRDQTADVLRSALISLLREMDRYRAYAVPGETVPPETAGVIAVVAQRARSSSGDPQQIAAIDAVTGLILDTTSGDGLRDEFVVRFQQTCGPVMAKGIEDTLFYRWLPLLALNEVGADPHRFGYSPSEFHAFASRIQRDWPATMTTLSTHDTKRSEDARARLYALTEVPDEWAAATSRWQEAAQQAGCAKLPFGAAHLVWQTLIAVWGDGPPESQRVLDYLVKALREAKQLTSWTVPDEKFESLAAQLAQFAMGDPATAESIGAFVQRLAASDRATVLGQKLIQLTMPGVPDVYQGCELVNRSLVDPDNRRPVDYPAQAKLLKKVAAQAGTSSLDAEKLLVASRALNLRRDHPEWFGPESGYTAMTGSSDHAVAFGRGRAGDEPAVMAIVTRLALRLAEEGGWGRHTIGLPSGSWTDVLTGQAIKGGPAELADVLTGLPVALLVRT